MTWNMREEQEYEEEATLCRTSFPPKTEQEKTAAKKAVEAVAERMGKHAQKEYEETIEEIVKNERDIRELKETQTKLMKSVNMTQEELNKLM